MVEIAVLAFVVGCLAALLRGTLFRTRTGAENKGIDGERRVAAVIKSLGFPAHHDVYLPSINGTTQIDHVVRVGNSIVVIETKNLSGTIYGSATDRNWRQSFRRGDGRAFLNPVIQNGIHTRAVRATTGGEADIRALVVMAGTATFPQGQPAEVVKISDLKQTLRLAFVDAGRYGTVEEPWARLEASIRQTDRRAARASHADTVRRATRRRDGNDPHPSGRIEPRFD